MKKQLAQLLLVAILLALVADTNTAQKLTRSPAVGGRSRAIQLGSVEQFKEAFHNDASKVRLVALISPT